MIEQLMVKDYILFEKGEVDFRNNMAVITGETGAGKSLLIDAIGYLSGGRMSSSVVRQGSEKAVLQMVLSNPSEQARKLLEENDYDAEDEIIIRRVIQANGKGRTYINSQAATNAFVRKLVDMMVDVHSQMDTARLMDPVVQMELLDRYARTEDLKNQVASAFGEYNRLRSKLKKLQNETFSDAELELITAQLNEIQNAEIHEGELEELQQNLKTASHAEKNIEDYSSVLYYFSKDSGIMDQLADAVKILKRNASAAEIHDRLHDLYYALMDIQEELKESRDELQSAGLDLDALQEREYLIKKLFRKYGGNYEAMRESEKALNERVDRILHRQDLFDQLEKEKNAALKKYMELARSLSEKRKSVFTSLKEQIELNARDMMLEHCVFEIQAADKEPSRDGIDEIEFLVSMNPGQPLTPLKTSASGGELSRLMLALKVVFQASNGIGTLIFDEIDTGVSGKVALAMGSKMHKLAENYQVLCITHLSSVAAWADDHFHVKKESDGQVTTTQVRLLSEPEHYEELAVMSNGSATPKAVESMRELVREIRS